MQLNKKTQLCFFVKTLSNDIRCLGLAGLVLSRILGLLHGLAVSEDLVLAAGALGLALGILVRLAAGMTTVDAAVLLLFVDEAET